MVPATTPSVGLFWGFLEGSGSWRAIFSTTELNQADRYGDCLTDERGHSDVWEHWQSLSPGELKALNIPLPVKMHPYEHWPRGRVIYEIDPARFVIYADRLHGAEVVVMITDAFGLQGRDLTCVVGAVAVKRISKPIF
jgi:hypothetical protein